MVLVRVNIGGKWVILFPCERLDATFEISSLLGVDFMSWEEHSVAGHLHGEEQDLYLYLYLFFGFCFSFSVWSLC